MKRNLLLGNDVLLKNGTKTVIIYGRRKLQADTGEVFDYAACFYPEGNISPEYTSLFNGDSIDKVIFVDIQTLKKKNSVKNYPCFLE